MNASTLDNQTRALLASLTAQIAAALPEWFGTHATLVTPNPEVRRLKQSFFIRYAVCASTGVQKTLLLKIPRKPELLTLAQAVAAKHLAYPTRQEFDSLLTMANVFQQANPASFCQIHPFAYLAAWNAIAMEELPAQSLKHLLLRPRMALGLARDWIPLQAALQRAGEWLRIFHEQLGEGREELEPTGELQTEIDQALAQLGRTASCHTDLHKLQKTFTRAVMQVKTQCVQMVTLHGDFNYGNILVMPDGRVGAIDTKRRQRGPIYIDLAALITDPATRKLQVLSQGWFVRSYWLAGCHAAVLQGYFGATPCHSQLLNLYSALAVLRKWTLDEELLAAATGARRRAVPFFAPLLRRYFTQLLQALLVQ